MGDFSSFISKCRIRDEGENKILTNPSTVRVMRRSLRTEEMTWILTKMRGWTQLTNRETQSMKVQMMILRSLRRSLGERMGVERSLIQELRGRRVMERKHLHHPQLWMMMKTRRIQHIFRKEECSMNMTTG